MIETYLRGWWAMLLAYLSEPAALAAGTVSALTLVPTAGLLLLVAGLVLAVVQRVGRAARLAVPAVLTLLSPVLVLFIENTIGWLGRILIAFFLVGALLIWIGLVVGLAPRKLPIWLIGLGLVSVPAYFGLVTLVPLLV